MKEKKKKSGPWYPRYIEDYRGDTKRLSLAEHGAYNLLLDEYYATGEPLPIDYVQLHRVCSALAPSEQAAVQDVIMRYFRQTADGWVHDRVEEELKKSNYISEVRRNAREERERKRATNAPANEGAFVNTTTTTTTIEEDAVEANAISLPGMAGEIGKIVGWDNDPNWTGHYGRLSEWIAGGWSYELDILPTIREVMRRSSTRPRSLSYFDKAIADAYARRTRPLPVGNGAVQQAKKSMNQKMIEAAAQAAARLEEETR
jgi:uncharacterized protein YdaU (DUF1376 family)